VLVTENIGQPSQALYVFNSGVWVAQSFTTDATSYTLSSITIQMVTNVGGGFTLSLYDTNAGNPGMLVDTLTGSTSPNELTTYLPSATVLLNPSTTYFAVAKASSGSYGWRLTGSTSQTGPGTIGDTAIVSLDSGSSWSPVPTVVGKLRVDGVAVPEASSVLCLGLICSGALGAWAIKKRRGRRTSS
jgi:hypothetical protein